VQVQGGRRDELEGAVGVQAQAEHGGGLLHARRRCHGGGEGLVEGDCRQVRYEKSNVRSQM
jgi:hypothetical protein